MVGEGVNGSEGEPRSSGPAVILRDGDEASGMATMIAGLLEDNLRDFPGRARVASRTRGAIVLTASDRDVSITLSFGRNGVEVSDGAQPGIPAMAGPWLTMSRVCSGRITPFRAIADRELKVTPGRSLWVVPAAGFVLSVPASFYGDAEAIRKQRLQIAAVVVTILTLIVIVAVIRAQREST